MKKLIFLTGASGVGKSTLLKHIDAHYFDGDIIGVESSARPFLPKGGSYDQTLTDESQAIIVQSRTLSVLDFILNSPSEAAIFTRSAIDNLAYQRVLQKGQFMDECNKREVALLANADNVVFIYIPIEFPLDSKDKVRGTNEEVRTATDKVIYDILTEFNIPHYTIKGTIEERCHSLDVILQKLDIDSIPF